MKHLMPETPPEYDSNRLIERPDGFHWRMKGRAREYGPFATLLEAVQDMELADDETLEPIETVQEAEAEIGIADWIDPDTGELAGVDGIHIEEH
jgi:hypothetical protein